MSSRSGSAAFKFLGVGLRTAVTQRVPRREYILIVPRHVGLIRGRVNLTLPFHFHVRDQLELFAKL